MVFDLGDVVGEFVGCLVFDEYFLVLVVFGEDFVYGCYCCGGRVVLCVLWVILMVIVVVVVIFVLF